MIIFSNMCRCLFWFEYYVYLHFIGSVYCKSLLYCNDSCKKTLIMWYTTSTKLCINKILPINVTNYSFILRLRGRCFFKRFCSLGVIYLEDCSVVCLHLILSLLHGGDAVTLFFKDDDSLSIL